LVLEARAVARSVQFAVALAVKAGGGYLLADMLCQFRVRACADRTTATGDRVRRRLLERAIDDGARDLPHAGDARHAIASWALKSKGKLPIKDVGASGTATLSGHWRELRAAGKILAKPVV
jgi:hypothetical protein